MDATDFGTGAIKAVNDLPKEAVPENVTLSITVKSYRLDCTTRTVDSIDVTRTFTGQPERVYQQLDSTRENSRSQRRSSLTYFD